MKKFLASILLACAMLPAMAQDAKGKLIIANPLDLEYQFQPDRPARREAADPVCLRYGDAFYLFASKSFGYWRSEDLVDWQFIPCRSIATINEYAPTVLEYNGYMYFFASDVNRMFRNATPERDTWEEIPCHFTENQHDPYFYRDDDGRVYMYWGCSDVNPLVGAQVDPEDGFRIIATPDTLIHHHAQDYGWEAFGANNDEGLEGWNEGQAIIKHEGRYYLQYASPGAQFRIYADGCYVGDNPLGPFTYLKESPFSFKPGGFIGGAGHGDTFRDKNGNYWHIATMKISQRHMYERRLVLLPIKFDAEAGPLSYSAFADYPFVVPTKKTDVKFKAEPMMNLLSYNKKVTASSSLPDHLPSLAVNEQVEDWWSAASGKKGESLMVDLGSMMSVEAIQVNFSDEGMSIYGPEQPAPYQYIIEGSADDKSWHLLVDMTTNQKNGVHRLHLLDRPAKDRYVRITNHSDMPSGKFSLSGFRVFGRAKMAKPLSIKGLRIVRDTQDPRHFTLSWEKQACATGYVVEWGFAPNKMTHAITTFEPRLDARWFNKADKYYFRVKAYNEAGLGR